MKLGWGGVNSSAAVLQMAMLIILGMNARLILNCIVSLIKKEIDIIQIKLIHNHESDFVQQLVFFKEWKQVHLLQGAQEHI